MPDSIPVFNTKIVVNDVDAMAAFFDAVFGLSSVSRNSGGEGHHQFDELLIGADGTRGGGFTLLSWVNRPTPSPDGVMLMFLVPDIAAVIDRAVAAGGSATEPRKVAREGRPKIEISFVSTPEGHECECVQVVAS
ncbi:MAG: VOC family protein [Acidimicrobiales bacterium]|nr:VOC family protein [Acidimicrobiales bacterium]